MNRLLISLLLFTISCTREEAYVPPPPRCTTCTTTILSTKIDCPDLWESRTYQLCDSNARAFAQKHSYTWITPDGTTHRVTTTCETPHLNQAQL